MIAVCPKCNARYRIDPARLGSAGARLKCARCAAVFRVRAPEAAPPPAAPAASPPVEALEQRRADTASASQPPFPDAESAPDLDREKLVLVADAEVEGGKQIVAALSSWGLQPVLVHDGVEAMITVQRLLPRVVVLDAALPKMYGFQICEVIKRNQSLREITVVLVGAIHQSERYRRPPSQLYGADTYLERPDLPEGLAPILRQAGFTLREQTEAVLEPDVGVAPAEPSPVATSAPAPAPVQPAAPTPVPADDGLADARAKAERLARIIVSDIILYSPEKFEAAAAAGNLVEAMDADLEEGRSLFRQRIDPRIQEERDFLVEELQRVAAERSAR